MHTVKLSKNQRLKIMQLHEQRVRNTHIAERFGVAPGTISRIIKEDIQENAKRAEEAA